MVPIDASNTRSAFAGMNLSAIWSDEERPYDGLPDELKSFHYYFADMGHVIMAVLNSFNVEQAPDPTRAEIPVPVKTFLRSNWSWNVGQKYLIVDLFHDNLLGLLYDESDIEY